MSNMKTCVAIVAALCAFAAVTTSAVPQHQKLDIPNADAILQKLQEVIAQIEAMADQAAAKVEDIAKAVQDAAVEAAGKWNQQVSDLAEKAHQAGVDVSACIQDEEELMKSVMDSLHAKTSECLAASYQELKDSIVGVKALEARAQKLLAEAESKIVECRQKGDFMAVTACLVDSLRPVHLEALRLVPEVAMQTARVAGKAAAMVPAATKCASSAARAVHDDASAIVEKTATCIKGKLDH